MFIHVSNIKGKPGSPRYFTLIDSRELDPKADPAAYRSWGETHGLIGKVTASFSSRGEAEKVRTPHLSIIETKRPLKPGEWLGHGDVIGSRSPFGR
jgi:hypothetical protein